MKGENKIKAELHERGIPLEKKVISEMFRRFKKITPAPTSELNYENSYTLLVAVVLSAQATDIGVNKATKDLFCKVKTPVEMIALGEEKLRAYIRTIGLYRNKAKNVIRLSEQLLANHNGQVPGSRKALEALAGVGRKTANVVMNVIFGEPTIAVDTHIFRVSNRTGLAPGKTPMEVELALEATIPKAYKMHAHHWLILHGRYICKARKPDCANCLIRDLCAFEDKLV